MTEWTAERTESLKKLWQDGLSASQIVKQLGGVSRSAVISKASRSGCSPRKPGRPPSTVPPRPKAVAVARPALRPAARPAFTSSRPEPVAQAPRATIVCVEAPGLATAATLGAHMCKWPIGEPTGDAFTFCGRHQERGPYCVEHALVAYGTPSAKAKANRYAVSRLGYSDLFAAS